MGVLHWLAAMRGDPARTRVTVFHSKICFVLPYKEKDRSSDFHCYDLLDASECMFDKKRYVGQGETPRGSLEMTRNAKFDRSLSKVEKKETATR